MSNPFENRSPSLRGPATDLVPVVPSDLSDLPTWLCHCMWKPVAPFRLSAWPGVFVPLRLPTTRFFRWVC